VMRAEIAKSETRLAEIILNLLTPKCGAHYNAEQEDEVATSAEFTTFYKHRSRGETRRLTKSLRHLALPKKVVWRKETN
jgi:hypothetical protein